MKKIVRKNLLILFFIHSFLSNLIAQGENDNWIFGNGSYISFSSGKPVVMNDVPAIRTAEGCTSVSSKDGRLLFYSDGMSIWTKDHNIMDNGKGLLGDYSSTSSCVIVPFPAHPNQYYVFCTDANYNVSKNGLTYNIVDLAFNNGLGKVTLKNQLLLKPTDEKIAVTRHCNGKDFWIVTHKAQSTDFYTWLLSRKGLSEYPTITSINESFSAYTELGFLKFSPDGRWLVNTQCLGQKLEIYSFDKFNGKITKYAFDNMRYNENLQNYYGVAFSANSSKLYVSCLDTGSIYQYDLDESPLTIFLHRTLLYCLKHKVGALQLASDNKIYISNGYDTYLLHSILNPNLKGLDCNFKLSVVKLHGGNSCQLGLPTYVESVDKYFSITKDSIINQVGYILDAGINDAIYEWSTGETTRSIKINANGTYWVKVYAPNLCILMLDSIKVNIYSKKLKLSNDYSPLIEVCEGQMINIPVFRCDSGGVFFNWTNSNKAIGLPESGSGQINPFIAPTVMQNIKSVITVTPYRDGRIGVPYILYLQIDHSHIYKIAKMNDVVLCSGSKFKQIEFASTPVGAVFTWKNNNTGIGLEAENMGYIESFITNLALTNKTATIKVKASAGQCFSDSITFNVLLMATPITGQVLDVAFCANEKIVSIPLHTLPAMATINWLSSNPDLHLTIIDSSLQFIKSPKVSEVSGFKITYNSILQGCKGQTLSFNVTLWPAPIAAFKFNIKAPNYENPLNRFVFTNLSLSSVSYYWNFGDEEYSIEKDPIHLFYDNKGLRTTLVANNNFGCSDTFSSDLNPPLLVPQVSIPNALSPDENGGRIFKVYDTETAQIQFWIYNRWGEMVFYSPDNRGWNGVFKDQPCEEGVYLYIVKARDFNNQDYEYKGTLTLLR